jgi:hypothetical protein
MNTERFETDKIVKLIEFSIKNKKFMPKEAMNSSGLDSLEFVRLANIIYLNRNEIKDTLSISEILEWQLKPEYLFQYMSLHEFKHAIKVSSKAEKSARYAHYLGIASLTISSILALSSIFIFN